MKTPAPRLGIALGDPTGVGPEVTLRALDQLRSDPNTPRFLLLGPGHLVAELNEQLGTGIPLVHESAARQDDWIAWMDPSPDLLPRGLPPSDPLAAQAALDALQEGARRCLSGSLGALITAPVSKEAIISAGHPDFVGQTEFLSDLAGTRRTIMMLLGADDRGRWLRVALATNHVPIARVSERLSTAAIELAIERAAEACAELALGRARVAVCGLNPHAGEGGKIGTEERKVIEPAVESTRARGLDVHGPFAADTLFHQVYQGGYDAVVAMYHDQGLVPLKMVAFDRGVNWTLGLPFIRTSPDHGTAYDIAGRGVARPGSMVSAIELAAKLWRRKAPGSGA